MSVDRLPRCRRWFRLGSLLIGIGLAESGQAQAVLGAHTLLGQEDGTATSPALTQPVTTAASGSYLLSFSAGYTSNSSGGGVVRGGVRVSVESSPAFASRTLKHGRGGPRQPLPLPRPDRSRITRRRGQNILQG